MSLMCFSSEATIYSHVRVCGREREEVKLLSSLGRFRNEAREIVVTAVIVAMGDVVWYGMVK